MTSIALATYNGGEYIKEQLDSILSQTIQNFEVVVCDDCSTDITWDILQEYQKTDNRIRLYRNDKNLGFIKNFEKAISLCVGEYIALCDQDDVWTSNHLEVLLENIGEKSIACGNAELMNEEGASWGYKLSEIERVDVFPQDEIDRAYRMLYFSNPYQGASMLIKREFFKYALPIPDANYHDAWFAILACFNGGIQFVDEVITYYRQHDSNASEHSKWSVWKAIKRLKPFSFYLTDRKLISEEILSRVQELSIIEKEVLLESVQFHSKKTSFIGRWQNLPILFSNYSRIYTTHSKSLMIPRLFKSLL